MERKSMTPLALRLDDDTLARIDALAVKLSRPGLSLTRTAALRLALAEGLTRLEGTEAKRRK
jgi:predicted transcriptional regulator